MSVPLSFKDLAGSWIGPSKLNLSWPPESARVWECTSNLNIEFGVNQAYAEFKYEWSHDGKPQTGLMILACDEDTKEASIGWSDSYHQSASVLHLKGPMSDDVVTCLGECVMPGYDPFGWEIQLKLDDTGNLSLDMTYIDPSGEREWAVAAVYSRIQSS